MAKIENFNITIELSQRELHLITVALRHMSEEGLYDYSADDQDAAILLKELTQSG